jgi:hypothetical protein
MSFHSCWNAFYRGEKPPGSDPQPRAQKTYIKLEGIKDLTGLEDYIKANPRKPGQDFDGVMRAYINRPTGGEAAEPQSPAPAPRPQPPKPVVTNQPAASPAAPAPSQGPASLQSLTQAVDSFWDRWPGPENEYKSNDRRDQGEAEFLKNWQPSDVPAFLAVTLARLTKFEADQSSRRRMHLGHFKSWCGERWKREKAAPPPARIAVPADYVASVTVRCEGTVTGFPECDAHTLKDDPASGWVVNTHQHETKGQYVLYHCPSCVEDWARMGPPFDWRENAKAYPRHANAKAVDPASVVDAPKPLTSYQVPEFERR